MLFRLVSVALILVWMCASGCQLAGTFAVRQMLDKKDERHTSDSSSPTHIESASRLALDELCRTVPEARKLRSRAAAVLVFPDLYEISLLMGGSTGVGTLFRGGRAAGFYRSAKFGLGLQAGGQRYSLAMFFMSAKDLEWLRRNGGWTVGTGTTVTFLDKENIREVSNSATRKGIYFFTFDQEGLAAGVSVEGMSIHPHFLGEK